jgi:sugar phosphate permease
VLGGVEWIALHSELTGILLHLKMVIISQVIDSALIVNDVHTCVPQGNSKALATVSAIIDGMGSIGAALGPMMTGYISDWGGFDLVFVMLYISAFTAGLLLIKLAARELVTLRARPAKPLII